MTGATCFISKTCLLLQSHGLVGAITDLGGFNEGDAGTRDVIFGQGLNTALIGDGSLVGLRVLIRIPAPPGQGRNESDRQDTAHDGQPRFGKSLVSGGAELLLDLLEDINHGSSPQLYLAKPARTLVGKPHERNP